MPEFTIHTVDDAPLAARESLRTAREKFGFVPNLLGELAAAPPALDAYVTLSGLMEKTSFTPVEQQLILAAASIANGCEYCVAAHSGGLKSAGLAEGELQALREGRPLSAPKLEALRRFVTAVVQKRGHVPEEEVQAFLNAGFRKEQIFEVMLGVAMKTLSNYTNHIAKTPLDPQLREFSWEAEKVAVGAS